MPAPNRGCEHTQVRCVFEVDTLGRSTYSLTSCTLCGSARILLRSCLALSNLRSCLATLEIHSHCSNLHQLVLFCSFFILFFFLNKTACTLGHSQANFQQIQKVPEQKNNPLTILELHWAPSIKLESVESIHGRSIKLENQVESIQRPGYESRVNLHHDAEPRAKVVLEGVAIYFFLYGPGRLRRGQIQCRSIISCDFRRFSRTRFTR